MPTLTTTELLRSMILNSDRSVCELAAATGIPQQVLHRFSSGQQQNIRLDTAEKLFREFELTVDRGNIRSKMFKIGNGLLKRARALTITIQTFEESSDFDRDTIGMFKQHSERIAYLAARLEKICSIPRTSKNILITIQDDKRIKPR